MINQHTKENDMKDLDGYDVEQDAQAMFTDYLDSLLYIDDVSQMRDRYLYGKFARQENPDQQSILVVQTIDYARSMVGRLETSVSYPDETDYSAWYGGEQGYRDGLRWSDFI